MPEQVRPSGVVPARGEPLRQKRKRELRQQLSDVATRLFLEHGFDAVRVADVAQACGVTEKTVYNHFPSKESLLADRWQVQAQALRHLLSDPVADPLGAALRLLADELRYLTSAAGQDGGRRLAELRRFSELIQSTPSLVAHGRESLDQLTAILAAALAERTGAPADAPQPWIIATAITGLWTVYFHSLHRHLGLGSTARLAAAVHSDLQTAAETLRRGL